MAKYIDANRLLDARFKTADHPYRLGWNDALEAARENAPKADVVEVRHGYWQNTEGDSPKRIKALSWWCSECGESILCSVPTLLSDFKRKNRYCRKCGAKMDG